MRRVARRVCSVMSLLVRRLSRLLVMQYSSRTRQILSRQSVAWNLHKEPKRPFSIRIWGDERRTPVRTGGLHLRRGDRAAGPAAFPPPGDLRRGRLRLALAREGTARGAR